MSKKMSVECERFNLDGCHIRTCNGEKTRLRLDNSGHFLDTYDRLTVSRRGTAKSYDASLYLWIRPEILRAL